MKSKEVIMWIMFISIGRRILILKDGGKWSFSYETKALIHLSQWGDWVCGAWSWKVRRLLCESMFILIGRWILILETVGSEVIHMKPKHQFICPNEEIEFMVPD